MATYTIKPEDTINTIYKNLGITSEEQMQALSAANKGVMWKTGATLTIPDTLISTPQPAQTPAPTVAQTVAQPKAATVTPTPAPTVQTPTQTVQTAAPTVAQTTTAAAQPSTTPAQTGEYIRYNTATGKYENTQTGQVYEGYPEDLDKTIAMLKGYYADAEKRGNIQSMIWAAEQADARRQELGLQPINQQLIARLKQQLASGTQQTQQPVSTTAAQPTGQYIPSTTPAVTYQGQIPTFNVPEYQAYQSPYESSIKQVLDEIASQKPYESPYAQILNDLVNKITTRTFSYDPQTDPEFQRDSKLLTQAVMEEMNRRGLLASTMTADRIQQSINDLLISYRSKAYEQYLNEGQNLLQQANFILGLDETGYRRYQDEYTQKKNLLSFLTTLDDRQYQLFKDARDYDYEMRVAQYQSAVDLYNAQLKQIEKAWDRVDELGYVDNEAAIILGVPPGTESKAAREAREEREQAMEKMRQQYEYELNQLKEKYKMEQEVEQALITYKAQYATTTAKPEAYSTTEIQNLSPFELGTIEQVNEYYNTKQALLSQANNIAARAWEMAYTRPDIELTLGTPLYRRLLSELQQMANAQKAAGVSVEPAFTARDYYKDAKEMKNAKYTQTDHDLYGVDQALVGKRVYSDEEVIDYVMNAPLAPDDKAETLSQLGYNTPNYAQTIARKALDSAMDGNEAAEFLTKLFPKGEAARYVKNIVEAKESTTKAKVYLNELRQMQTGQ